MIFQNFSTLDELHVEITNRCNAACPMCSRNVFGGKQSEHLQINDWSKEDGHRVFSDKKLQLRNILFCGTHGDPASAKDCLEIAEIAKSNTKATIEFYSNGSIRKKQWWYDLGSLLSTKKNDDYYRKSDLGVFSVDGLADTNHLYRRHTKFQKIMENAEAFIKGGGRARWDFLVFKHNEHQVEEAEKLAKKMGFSQFRVRKTSRFAYSPDGPDKHRVLDKHGNIEYYLEPATQEKFLNKTKKKFEEIVKKEKDNELEFTEKIQCLNQTQFNRMYVNARLEVFPCCFLSSDTYNPNSKFYKDSKNKVFNLYSDRFNSLRNHSWEEILDHPWYKENLVSSWDSPEKKLIRCQRTCSVKCNPITSQSVDSTL